MRLQTTATLRQALDKARIDTVEELMYADLRRIGWTAADAFYVSFRHIYGDYPIRQQKAVMDALETNPRIKDRMTGMRPDNGIIPLDELNRETSKEKILSDLLKARKRTREGTKEWNDLTKMIADYAKIKQDDLKTDEQPIRYYLPVHYPTSCKKCLVAKNKERKRLDVD